MLSRIRIFLVFFLVSITPLLFAATSTSESSENTSIISTGDNLKKQEALKLELEASIQLEKTRILAEQVQKDNITNLLDNIYTVQKTSEDLQSELNTQ